MLEYILYQLCCLTMSHVIIEAPEEMLVIPTVILVSPVTVQSYTGKYQEFAAICIVMSMQHE